MGFIPMQQVIFSWEMLGMMHSLGLEFGRNLSAVNSG